jgi:uncharacterized protein YerC
MATKKNDIVALRVERLGWKKECVDALNEDIRNKFEKRKEAVDMYIDGYTLNEIESRTGIDKANIARYVNKCIERKSNEDDKNAVGYE